MFNQAPEKIVATNRLPVIVGIIVFILVMAVFAYKSQMHAKAPATESQPKPSIDASSKALSGNWFNEKKFKDIKINTNLDVHKPSLREIETQLVSDQVMALKKEEMQDSYETQLEVKKIEDKNMIEEKKLELEADKSPLSIEVPPPPGTKADPKASTHQDPLTDSLHEIINMAKSSSPDEKLSALGEAGAQLVNNINNQEGKQSFLKNIDTGGDYLESSLQKPRSRYEIKAGSYIPAALITGINSDLPGNVSAQVTENVFDTITGNYLLIPQGARLVGEYNSNLSFGQMRVQVVWKRIIFPDGKSLDLKKMQGADISGYTGFHDQINNHYFRIYGSAVLLSFMGAGYDILNQDNRQNQTYESPRSIVAANVGQKLSDVSSQALEKNMDVQPTIIINPGYKFNIMVIKDMVLENIKDAQGALGYSE